MDFIPKKVLVTTFNEKRAPNSRKNVSKRGVIIPNFSETVQSSWSHSVFDLEKYPKSWNFQSLLPLKEALVSTFNEKRAPTSRKYAGELSVVMPNLLQALNFFFCSRSSAFALEKYPKNLNVRSFFTFQEPLVSRTCTHFQKICIYAKCNRSKFINDTSIFLVALLRFYLRKVV